MGFPRGGAGARFQSLIEIAATRLETAEMGCAGASLASARPRSLAALGAGTGRGLEPVYCRNLRGIFPGFHAIEVKID